MTKFGLLGENSDHVVLFLDNTESLLELHKGLTDYGYKHSYDEYQPHITVGKIKSGNPKEIINFLNLKSSLIGKNIFFDKIKFEPIKEERCSLKPMVI